MSGLKLIADVSVATMAPEQGGYGLVREAGIGIEDGRIVWVGPMSACGPEFRTAQTLSFDGRLVTPALIDCHTHIVFAGNRAREFEMRLEGASYEEIARAGGGIISTMALTREASEAELLAQALPRVDSLIREGVTVIEVKSGYGMEAETELKMLRVARQIEAHRPVRIKTSYLGAHAIPKGMSADGYIDDVCIPALRDAHGQGLVDAVDGFVERFAFTTGQIARVFDAARELGLPVKLHAEQLSNQGGAAMAASYGALSADHVEYANEEDARAMAASGTVAVLLPGAFYTLRETQKPPVQAFRDAGVAMALATDWNPGSSPMGSLLLAMNMGCTLFGMTPAEALAATTRNAAKALGLDDCGIIAPGRRADLAVWDVEEPAELSYRFGYNPLHVRIFGGAS